MNKVCIVTSWFPSKEKPAIAPFVYNFARNLASYGLAVNVITKMSNGEESIVRDGNLQIHRIGGVFFTFSMYRILKNIRPDIVNIHAPNFFSSPSVVLCKLLNIPLVATVYRGEVDKVSKPLHILRKVVIRSFKRIIVCSNFTRDLIIKAGADSERLSIIHNSSNESVFYRTAKNSARSKINVAQNMKVILFVGNLIRLKGVYTLLEALNIVNQQHPFFNAILVGDGDERENLEALARKRGIENCIKFTGWIPQSELAEFLNAADLFVLPSTVEGQSVAILEAMACGCPIIASQIPGNMESITDSYDGLFFKPEDPRDLAEKILSVLTDEALAINISKNAMGSYSSKFSEERQVKKYVEVYGSVIENSCNQYPKSDQNVSKPSLLLFDNYGLSHFTAYMARGLSRHYNIKLYGFSKDEFETTGAASSRQIYFENIGASRMLSGKGGMFALLARPLLIFSILLKALMKQHACDIVHVQGHLPMFFMIVPFLRILSKKSIFWTIHDISLRPSSPGLRGNLELLYVRALSQPNLLTKYADTIIVHGSRLKERIVSRGAKRDKVFVLPHFDYDYLLPFLDNQSSKLQRISEISNNTADYILFFGRIAPYKGIELLLEAFKVAKQKGRDYENFEIVIAGRGDISFLKEHISDKTIHSVHVINRYIANYEIPELFCRARFVVLPYVDASQSGVLSLSYTFSKAVVVSNAGSMAEFVEPGITGLVFESGNLNELAECILTLFKNESASRSMGQQARRKLVEEMSLDGYCRELNELYKRHLRNF